MIEVHQAPASAVSFGSDAKGCLPDSGTAFEPRRLATNHPGLRPRDGFPRTPIPLSVLERHATNDLRSPVDRSAFERHAGRLLRLLKDTAGYRSLGYARLAEYVIERLGVGNRTAQEMMRVDAALESLPLTAAAAASGDIGSGHLRLLTRVARPDTEAFWLSLAGGTTVRELARLLSAAADHGVTGGCPPHQSMVGNQANPSDGVAGDDVSRPGIGGDDRASWLGAIRGGRDLAPAGSEAGAGSGPGGNGCDPASDGEMPGGPCLADGQHSASDGPHSAELPLQKLKIGAPAWVATLWRDTLPIVRRLAGSDLPPGACLELVLAEISSDVGAESEFPGDYADNVPSPAPAPAAGERHEPSRVEDAGRRSDVRLAPGEADVELMHLLGDHQRRQADLAEHLRLVALDRGYRDEGFSSLEEFALDRFGLPSRTFYHLLAVGRAFRYLPALRREFLSARLTARQAVLLGSVASSLTVQAWVGRARSVTLRRLEDEINFWTHLKKTRPEVWDLLDGGPLPEGIDLAPGQPARLQMSAHRSSESGQSSEVWGPGGVLPEEMDLVSGQPAQLQMSALREKEPLTGPAQPKMSAGEGRSVAGSVVSASAPSTDQPAISATAFLRALDEDEAATPLPQRLCEIRLFVEPQVAEMWRDTVRKTRTTVRESLEEWEVLAIVLKEFLLVWDNSETRRQRRENPTLERDGWRCTAPGCRSMGTGRLQEHHVIFRSHGGPETDPRNLTTLCNAHHAMLHEGLIRCSGEAPGGLRWEMGVRERGEPFLVYLGETRIGGTAL